MAKQSVTRTVAKSMKRGDQIARNGVVGIFVGVDKLGVWVAWEPESFENMCFAFDLAASKKR